MVTNDPGIEPYIETYTGKRMYFLEPTPDMIDIVDIAHALSNTCRFGGHSKTFYSVAQHSVYVGDLAENHLEGLLHDASEAYLVDIPKPIKGYLVNYKEIEARIMEAVAKKFGAGWPLSDDTKDADSLMLKAEASQIMKTGGQDWLWKFPTRRTEYPKVTPYPPEYAETLFLEAFKRYS